MKILPMTIAPKLQKILLWAGIGLLVAALVAFNLWFFCRVGSIGLPRGGSPKWGRICRIGLPREVLTKWGRIIPTPLPTPTPTPKPIPTGKQAFSVSSGKKTGPQFQTGTIDPYDPARGSHQLWTVNVKSEKPVTKASLTLTTDTQARTLPLELKEGSPTDGLWTATWIAGDTYLYTYLATFTASDGTEENTVELTLR